ncbi:hypothetical protein BDF19DRAFT_415668 [Syncephalis fuscata]|nr:hypothetical protein BDF19DRAFT_415668 [Syncephalis fuscata]
MFKRWTETKSSTKQSSEPEQLHTSFLSTSLLTLVSESKDKPATPETKLGFNSWSLRGKEKAVETTGLPVVTPVTVTSIHAKAASSNGTTSSGSTVLNAAGHLAGIVAAATSKPLVGKPVSGGHPILAPKLLGTARRIGLTTVANMARFAANLHQFRQACA